MKTIRLPKRKGSLRRVRMVGLALLFFASVGINGCKTVETVSDIGATIGVASGVLNAGQANSLRKSLTAVAKTAEDITPEQEYYIGRTVGAVVISKYRPYDNIKANEYLNLIGQTLAQASDLPETFGGYHFLVLDSDEINAFAAPSGLIFVTRGMLRCCPDEDAVAAVLAHEIGHVQARHGLQAIKNARVTTAVTTLAMEGVKTFADADLAGLTQAFEGSISDITSTMINSGYSREFEQQADRAAIEILKRMGYRTGSLVEMLTAMQERIKPGGMDFAKTHPAPVDRIQDVQPLIDRDDEPDRPESRRKRFSHFMKGI